MSSSDSHHSAGDTTVDRSIVSARSSFFKREDITPEALKILVTDLYHTPPSFFELKNIKDKRTFEWRNVSRAFSQRLYKFGQHQRVFDTASEEGRATFIDCLQETLRILQLKRFVGSGLGPVAQRRTALEKCQAAQIKAFQCGSGLQSQVGDTQPNTPAPQPSWADRQAPQDNSHSGSVAWARTRASERSTVTTRMLRSQALTDAARHSRDKLSTDASHHARKRPSTTKSLTRSRLSAVEPADTFNLEGIDEISVARLIQSVYDLSADWWQNQDDGEATDMAAITRDLKDTLRNEGLKTFSCNDENAQHSIISGLRAALERATQEGYAHELITSRRDQECFSAELDGTALRNAFVKQPISLTDITAEGRAFHMLMKHVYDLNGYEMIRKPGTENTSLTHAASIYTDYMREHPTSSLASEELTGRVLAAVKYSVDSCTAKGLFAFPKDKQGLEKLTEKGRAHVRSVIQDSGSSQQSAGDIMAAVEALSLYTGAR